MRSLVDGPVGAAALQFKPCTMHQQGESKYVPTAQEPEHMTHAGVPRLILKECSDPWGVATCFESTPYER